LRIWAVSALGIKMDACLDCLNQVGLTIEYPSFFMVVL